MYVRSSSILECPVVIGEHKHNRESSKRADDCLRDPEKVTSKGSLVRIEVVVSSFRYTMLCLPLQCDLEHALES